MSSILGQLGDLFVPALLGAAVSWALNAVILWRNNGGGTERGGDFHHAVAGAVPRYGGVALVGAFIAAVVVSQFAPGAAWFRSGEYLAIFLGSVAVFSVGLWDDVKSLGARWKFALQIIIALMVYWGGVRISGFKNPFTGVEYSLGGWGVGLTVLWLVAMTNLINLIDGIDGLAAGIALMLMSLLAYVGVVHGQFHTFMGVAMIGALLAFLRYNFPPARIYLGDGGAYFLGFLIGALSIVNSNKGTVVAALLAPLIAMGLPIADTALTMVRRAVRGLPLFRADRKHIHHRLIQSGFSRTRAVLMLYALSLALSLTAFGLFWAQGRWVAIMLGLVFLLGLTALRSANFGGSLVSFVVRPGTSLEIRQETRYALTLSAWLELEAERCATMDALWNEFLFLVRKLGFTRVRLVLPEGDRSWESPDGEASLNGRGQVFEFRRGLPMLLEFHAPESRLGSLSQELLAELAAEAWLKAVTRWRQRTRRPVKFATGGVPATAMGTVAARS